MASTVGPAALTRPRRAHAGQGAVETALVLFLFLFLVMGTADFAWAYLLQNSIANGVREGARRATVRQCRDSANPPTTANSIEYAVYQGMPATNYAYTNLTVTFSGGSATTGSTVSVTYSQSYQPFTPLAGPVITGILGATPTISATAVMTVDGVSTSCA
ncbi:MAG: pilus assembly protein [Chloroflexi bacterium]|nr:pilus assembly protein [Chloroflexota bacterium]